MLETESGLNPSPQRRARAQFRAEFRLSGFRAGKGRHHLSFPSWAVPEDVCPPTCHAELRKLARGCGVVARRRWSKKRERLLKAPSASPAEDRLRTSSIRFCLASAGAAVPRLIAQIRRVSALCCPPGPKQRRCRRTRRTPQKSREPQAAPETEFSGARGSKQGNACALIGRRPTLMWKPTSGPEVVESRGLGFSLERASEHPSSMVSTAWVGL